MKKLALAIMLADKHERNRNHNFYIAYWDDDGNNIGSIFIEKQPNIKNRSLINIARNS